MAGSSPAMTCSERHSPHPSIMRTIFLQKGALPATTPPMPATARAFPPASRRRSGAHAMLRLGLRVVAGLTHSQAAAAEPDEAARAEAEELVADPDFAPLVDACREFEELPEADRLARLERLAWNALELALAHPADTRVAAFVLLMLSRKRNPATVLAESANAAWRRTHELPPEPPRAASFRDRSAEIADPSAGYAARGAARLQDDMLDEQLARGIAVARDAERRTTVATTHPSPVQPVAVPHRLGGEPADPPSRTWPPSLPRAP
jgi:hypothetical protein